MLLCKWTLFANNSSEFFFKANGNCIKYFFRDEMRSIITAEREHFFPEHLKKNKMYFIKFFIRFVTSRINHG